MRLKQKSYKENEHIFKLGRITSLILIPTNYFLTHSGVAIYRIAVFTVKCTRCGKLSIYRFGHHRSNINPLFETLCDRAAR